MENSVESTDDKVEELSHRVEQNHQKMTDRGSMKIQVKIRRSKIQNEEFHKERLKKSKGRSQ